MAQLRNAPFGTSPRLAARSLSRTGRFFASASRPRCWVVMQGYEVRTCSAAPRFKTVTASLSHSFGPPTWKLIHRVHMTRKTSFCPLGQKLVFSSEACLTAREAALRAVKVLRREVSAEVCGTLPVTSCKARSFTLRNAQTFTPASPGHLPGRGRALAARRGLLAGREAFLRRILLPQALASLSCLLAT